MTNYLDLDLIEINKLLKDKKIKPIDLVNECIERIDANKEYNAVITVDYEGAKKRALELESECVDNLLFGIPIIIKDNICTKGIKTTCASLMLSNFVPVYDAFAVEKLKDKGMIIIGKANMDEFAMGSANETSYYGPVLNAYDKTRVSGGSSGGSAVVVAKRICPVSLGSDTGGSVRQPSSFNGVVGLKPTYGRVSRYGLVAFASSLDQIGPITRNVYENAIMLNAISKKDDKDLTSIETNEDFTRLINTDISGMKLAIPKFYMSDKINIEIRNKVEDIIKLLKNNNVTIDYVDIDYIEYSVPLYQIIALAEASSNLARYDGVRYGYRVDSNNIDDMYKKTRSMGFGKEVKRRIMIGSYVLSGENAKDYYYKALKVRKKICESFDKVFSKYDLVIGPVTTDFAYPLGQGVNDAVKSFTDDLLTIPANMAGLPAMSLPIGLVNNLPVGMHIIANKYDEAIIYKLASFIENKLKGGN